MCWLRFQMMDAGECLGFRAVFCVANCLRSDTPGEAAAADAGEAKRLGTCFVLQQRCENKCAAKEDAKRRGLEAQLRGCRLRIASEW
jgi:hypothetical protein